MCYLALSGTSEVVLTGCPVSMKQFKLELLSNGPFSLPLHTGALLPWCAAAA